MCGVCCGRLSRTVMEMIGSKREDQKKKQHFLKRTLISASCRGYVIENLEGWNNYYINSPQDGNHLTKCFCSDSIVIREINAKIA